MTTKCNLSGVAIEHNTPCILTFLIESNENIKNKSYIESGDKTVTVGDVNIFGQSYSSERFTSTRLSFDVCYQEYRFKFSETRTNIKNLKNLIDLLKVDFFREMKDGIRFLDENDEVQSEGEMTSFSRYFDHDYVKTAFEYQDYEDAFNYIIERIECAYINYHKKLIKLNYSLISLSAYEYITSPDFTRKLNGFTMDSIDELIDNVHEDNFDNEFEYESVFQLFPNPVSIFSYNKNIHSRNDFISVMTGYVVSTYIDYIFERLGVQYTQATYCEETDIHLLAEIMQETYLISYGEY